MYHPPTRKAPAADSRGIARQAQGMPGLTFENGFETQAGPNKRHNEDAAWWMTPVQPAATWYAYGP